jgi:peptidoglycan endopeptidase LytE
VLTAPLRPSSEDHQGNALAASQVRSSARTGAMRRRRVTFVLLGAFSVFAALGAAGYLAGWLVAVAVAMVAVAYRVVLGQVRRQSAQREWNLPAVGDAVGWEGWHAGLEDRPVLVNESSGEARGSLGPWAMCRFAFGSLAAWALVPVLAIAEQIAGGARADSRRQRWYLQLEQLQRYGRQQSMNALKVSMLATAGVGSLAAVGVSTPPASAASISTAASTTTRYSVAVGDTLGSIAQRFGTTVSTLAAVNDISDPNLVFVGQELVISGSGSGLSSGTGLPASGALTSPNTQSVSSTAYTVEAGDTLGAIAARFGTTVSALASSNGIANPNLIVVGQVLHVNGAPGATTSPVGTTPIRTTAAPPTGAHQTYTVQAGDTVAAIAARFGTTVSVLASSNGIANPNLIVVGQMLVISGGSLEAPAAGATPIPTPTIATPTTTSEPIAAATAVRVALAEVGKPYVWGAAGPSSFDCSGLVMYAYAAAGILLPHYTVSQFDSTTAIAESQLQPGDLVFYDTGDGAQPGHVTMYIGNGQVVSANSPGSNVQTQSIGYDGTIMGFRRVVY